MQTDTAVVYIYETTRRHVPDNSNFNKKQTNECVVYVVNNDMRINTGCWT